MKKRMGGLVTVGVLVALMLGVAAPAGAVSPGAPPVPVNFLPSTVKGGYGSSAITGTPMGDLIAFRVYNAVNSPGFWESVKATKAGTATPAQTAAVATARTNYTVPATKMGTLSRVGAGVGGAATAISGFAFGASIGHAALELTGFDANGTVCRAADGVAQSILAGVTGSDCAAFNALAVGYVPNTGIVAQLPGWRSQKAYWGNSQAGANLWVGTYTIQPTGSRQWTYSYVVDFSAGGPYDRRASSTFFEGLCVGAGGAKSRVESAFTIGGAVGSVQTGVITCPAGQPDLYAVGRTTVLGNQGPGEAVITELGVTFFDGGFAPLWFGPASPSAPLGVDADPERRLRCVLVSTTGVSVAALTPPYREGAGILPTPNCPVLPEGLTLGRTTVYEVLGGNQTELWSQESTPEFQALQALAPECSSATCMLDLRKADQSCFQNPTVCADWFKDPNKSSTYNCWYGTHAVDLAECSIYAPTFLPEATATGNTYGDWEGKTIPNPTLAPAGGTAPDSRKCWSSAWGDWNPLTWVLLPVKCAFEWAFIPSPQTIPTFQNSIKAKFDATPPGKIASTITGYAWPIIPPNGCDGFTISLAWMKQGAFSNADFPASFNLLGACPGTPLHPWAVFANLTLTVGFIVVAIKTWTGLVGKMFTYGGVDG